MNAPKLRFKCFQDEWKNIDLSKCFEYFSTNSLSRDSLSNEGVIKNIHYGDIHRKFNSIVDANVDIDTYIKDINYINKNELLKENDLIFADASEDYEGIGKSIEIINVGNNNIVAGLHTILARETNKFFSPKFKGYYFNSTVIHNQIRVLANGFKVFGISKTTINSIDAKIPSLVEQEKISNTLYLLDKKIELQSKKIEALKLYKKGLRKSIYKSITSKVTLSDTVNFYNGKGYENFIDENGIYNLISLNSIGIDENLNKNMKKIKFNNPETLIKNDIVMVMSDVAHGDFLGISTLIPENNKFVLNQRMGLLRIKDNTNPYFLVDVINYNQKNFKILGQGSSQLNLSKNDILNLCIEYPVIDIQILIGNISKNINKLINLEENKLINLYNLKKGLMQNMFV